MNAVKRLLVLLALPLMAQTAPPANVTMLNGQPRSVTPVAIVDGGASTQRTTAAGTSDTAAVPVQGVTGGVPQNVVARGSGTIATGQVSVGTTATLIAAARATRTRITVAVTTAVACSYGNAGVTLTTGYPLTAVAGASDTTDTTAALYGVCASTATVGYKEIY